MLDINMIILTRFFFLGKTNFPEFSRVYLINFTSENAFQFPLTQKGL